MAGCDFTVHIRPPRGKWRNAAGYRNITGGQEPPCVVAARCTSAKLIFSRGHVATPRDHECLRERDREISSLRQPAQSPDLHRAFAGTTWCTLRQEPAAEHRTEVPRGGVLSDIWQTGGQVSVPTVSAAFGLPPPCITSSPCEQSLLHEALGTNSSETMEGPRLEKYV
ncbi:Hypothetical protein SMAX5B_012033 [Scophthalmus maximus]|uniref:Uncharacterized protein n=1 Tax=Scophthalmus maximus TaxID=52904 RepID=A0A2U9AZD4_SCOMX|nr:Hypothetical protein SMAX5B_012033 [Scophthalmus maximus]